MSINEQWLNFHFRQRHSKRFTPERRRFNRWAIRLWLDGVRQERGKPPRHHPAKIPY